LKNEKFTRNEILCIEFKMFSYSADSSAGLFSRKEQKAEELASFARRTQLVDVQWNCRHWQNNPIIAVARDQGPFNHGTGKRPRGQQKQSPSAKF